MLKRDVEYPENAQRAVFAQFRGFSDTTTQAASLQIHHTLFGLTKVTLCGCEVAIASRRYGCLGLRATAPVDL
jgi:hypothetical protein